MARTDTFHVSVITPERAVLEADATFAAFPAHDGEVGVLRNRAPFLFKMGIGVLRVETAEGLHRLYVDGGFAQMVENRLTLLTEQAKRPEEVDARAADRAETEARAMKIADDASFAARQRALERARAQRRLATLSA